MNALTLLHGSLEPLIYGLVIFLRKAWCDHMITEIERNYNLVPIHHIVEEH